jgi:uncharacterized protein YjdB
MIFQDGDTIKLNSDLSESVYIASNWKNGRDDPNSFENVKVTFDLGGHTITSDSQGDYVFAVMGNDIDITVQNGKLVNNVGKNGAGGAFFTNGTYSNNTVTLKNLTIEAGLKADGTTFSGTAVYLPADGACTIDGCTISGTSVGVEIRSGSLNIVDSSITGGSGDVETVPNGNGATTANAAVAVAQHSTKKSVTVNIKSGSILSGTAAVCQSDPQGNGFLTDSPVSISLLGGTYNGKLVLDAATCKASITGGKYSVDPTDSLIVSSEKVVCKDGDYYTVVDAHAYGTANGTVKYELAEDHSSVTATQTCTNCGAELETVSTSVEHVVVLPTTEAEGSESYNATFANIALNTTIPVKTFDKLVGATENSDDTASEKAALNAALDDIVKSEKETELQKAVTQAILDGKEVTVEQVAAPAKPSEADQKLVDAELKAAGLTSGKSFEVEIVVKAGDEEIGTIPELSKAVDVVFNISDITPVKDGYDRIYQVIRIHDGKAETLQPKDVTATTLTVSSDKFSTYVVAYTDIELPVASVSYAAHVQNKGNTAYSADGVMAGTVGKALRAEAFSIKVDSNVSGGIKYRVHSQNTGWGAWASDGAWAGTTGKALRAEAIQVELTGNLADVYDVYYRVHVQGIGWMAWAKNGEAAGTTGMALRAEAIEVVLVEKGNDAPDSGSAKTAFQTNGVSVSAHVQNQGWKAAATSGVAGTTGKALRLEGLKMQLASQPYSGSIEYQVHVQNIGWQDKVSDGQLAGTTGKALRAEAVKVNLTGEMAEHFDVEYRVHVQNLGWTSWVRNGEAAGTTGKALRAEAIEVRLVAKNA